MDPDRQKLWLRISGMRGEVWSRSAATEGNQHPEFGDFARVPALIDPISIDRLLPSIPPEEHFNSLQEHLERTDEGPRCFGAAGSCTRRFPRLQSASAQGKLVEAITLLQNF